jgi:hypothetical protein
MKSAMRIVAVVLVLACTFSARADDDERRLAAYRLSMPVIQKLERAAVNVGAAMKANPQWRDEAGDHETLADIAEFHRERPALRQAIERAGLTPDEYALATLSWVQASMAFAVAQALPPERRAAALADAKVPAANVEFVRKNKAELDAMSRRLKAVSGDDE